MNLSIQTLGQSVAHWQAIYIVSISVALLSTFAIVVFAFHIQEHKFGLKVSNYIYVAASLLAVISTIIIVNETGTVDAQKSAALGKALLEAENAETSVAQIKQVNLTLQGDLVQLSNGNLLLQQQIDAYGSRQQGDERVIAGVNRVTSQRVFTLTEFQKQVLTQYKGLSVRVLVNDSDDEERKLLSDLYTAVSPTLNLQPSVVLGVSANLMLVPGLHLRYDKQPISQALADTLSVLLTRARIRNDVSAAQEGDSRYFAAVPDHGIKASGVALLIGPKPR